LRAEQEALLSHAQKTSQNKEIKTNEWRRLRSRQEKNMYTYTSHLFDECASYTTQCIFLTEDVFTKVAYEKQNKSLLVRKEFWQQNLLFFHKLIL
jgi:hypothetical protein